MGLSVDTGSIHYRDTRELPIDAMLALYRANHWSSAKKPALLHAGLLASHSLITAWHDERLVGLGNTLSDGYLVVYYSHLLVDPAYQRRGIGAELMRRLIARYRGFHQHILVADGKALKFYRKCGFERAGKTKSMWIFAGREH
jgi:GNAT superfamily N-acetyltransferase